MSETNTQSVAAEPSSFPVKAILAQKVGMTQIYDATGKLVPVTVVKAGPCNVLRVKGVEGDHYSAVQVSFGDKKKKSSNKAELGVYAKSNATLSRWIREFRIQPDPTIVVGQQILSSVFVPGDYVDVTGTSKGHGFEGTVKRHGFGGGPSTHGQSDRQRAPGSSGSNTYPGRVFKGKKFPGHMGVAQITVQHLEVIRVVPAENLIMLRGGVPGTEDGLLVIKQTIKNKKFNKNLALVADKKNVKKDQPKAATPQAKKGGK